MVEFKLPYLPHAFLMEGKRGNMANQYKKWTKEEVIEAIKDFYEREGRTPLTREYKPKYNLPSKNCIRNLFGDSCNDTIGKLCGLTMDAYGTVQVVDFEWEIKENTNRVIRFCNRCGLMYEVTRYQYDRGNKFCSKHCVDSYKKENPMPKLENPRFTQVLIKCDTCGEMHYKKPSRIAKNDSNFCSRGCFNEWLYKRSQTEEWKEARSKIAVKSLEDGNIPSSDTSIQIAITKILEDLEINYKKEKGFTYFSIDLYLLDYNIPIEIMGDYWHTNHNVYDEINYKHQVERIFKDKAKHTYILNNHNMEVLYLWESDINNSIGICEKLILKYIEDGSLENYHSFNYSINEGELILNDVIDEPYMNMSSEFIKSITNLDVVKSRSRRDDNKHIIFECEYCGKETDQLISKYNKSEHHFCSVRCIHDYKIMVNGTVVNCKECGEEFIVKNSVYKRYKTKEFSCEKCKSNKKEN